MFVFGLFKGSLGPAGRLMAPAVLGSNFAWDGDASPGQPAPRPADAGGDNASTIILRVTAPTAPPFWMLIYGADLERITGRGTVDAEAISEHEARFVIRPTVPGLSLAQVLDESRYVPERIATAAEGAIDVILAPIAPDGQPMASAPADTSRSEPAPSTTERPSDGLASLWLVREETSGGGADQVDAPAAQTGSEFAPWLQHPETPAAPSPGETGAPSEGDTSALDPWFAAGSTTTPEEGTSADVQPPVSAETSLLHAGVLGDAVESVDWLSLLRRDPAPEPKSESIEPDASTSDPWFDWLPGAPAEAEVGSPEADASSAVASDALGEAPFASDLPPTEAAASTWPMTTTDGGPRASDEDGEPYAETPDLLQPRGFAQGDPAHALEQADPAPFDGEPAEATASPASEWPVEVQPTSLFDAPLVALAGSDEAAVDGSDAEPADDVSDTETATHAPFAWPPVSVVNPEEVAPGGDAPTLGSAAPIGRPLAHTPVVLVQDLYRRPTRDAEPEGIEDISPEDVEPEVEDDPQLIELAQRKPRVRGVNTYFESLGNPPFEEPGTPQEATAQSRTEETKERKPKFKLLSLFKKKAPSVESAAVIEEIDFDRFQDLEPFWRRLAVLSVELGLGSSEGASGGLARAVESGVQDVSNLVVAGGITEEQFTDLAALALGVPRLRVNAATPAADRANGLAVPVGRVGHTLYVATASLDPAEAIAPFTGRAPNTQALLVSRAEFDQLCRGAARTISASDDDAAPRLGEVLVTFGHITNAQLDRALQRQEREQGSVGYLLRLSGEIDEATFIESLALQLGLPWLRVEQVRPYAEAVALIPTEVAERYGVLGVARTLEGVYVGFIDALDEEARDAVRAAANLPVLPIVVGRDGLARTFGRVFAA